MATKQAALLALAASALAQNMEGYMSNMPSDVSSVPPVVAPDRASAATESETTSIFVSSRPPMSSSTPLTDMANAASTATSGMMSTTTAHQDMSTPMPMSSHGATSETSSMPMDSMSSSTTMTKPSSTMATMAGMPMRTGGMMPNATKTGAPIAGSGVAHGASFGLVVLSIVLTAFLMQ